MIVISDTSCIINLAQVGVLELLPKIFNEIVIPQAVYDEIVLKGSNRAGADEIKHAAWIKIKHHTNETLYTELRADLDEGEAEAITLAIELKADLLIIDEDKGVFSPKFYRAFFPELKDEIMHFKRLTLRVYRECSEFVHGNNSVLIIMPENLEFNENLFNEWHKKALIIRKILLFVFNLRYATTLKTDELKSLENINIEEFSHIKAISDLY